MPNQDRPWQTDAEIERQQAGSMRAGYGQPQRPPKPVVTFGLLITIGVVFIIQLIVLNTVGVEAFTHIFTIHSEPNLYDWATRPWSPITATLSHGGIAHLLFNGIALYFFGASIEFILGRTKYLIFFFVTGAVSSILQAMIVPNPALGASGAIMGLIGMSIVLMPKSKLFIFPFPIPIPLWIGGIAFAVIDVLGAFSGATGIGNFAHLSGMAIGLVYGLYVKRDLKERGMRLVTH